MVWLKMIHTPPLDGQRQNMTINLQVEWCRIAELESNHQAAKECPQPIREEPAKAEIEPLFGWLADWGQCTIIHNTVILIFVHIREYYTVYCRKIRIRDDTGYNFCIYY